MSAITNCAHEAHALMLLCEMSATAAASVSVVGVAQIDKMCDRVFCFLAAASGQKTANHDRM